MILAYIATALEDMYDDAYGVVIGVSDTELVWAQKEEKEVHESLDSESSSSSVSMVDGIDPGTHLTPKYLNEIRELFSYILFVCIK